MAHFKSHHIPSGRIAISFLGHSNIKASTPQWCLLSTVHEFHQLEAEGLLKISTSYMAEGAFLWQPQSMHFVQLKHELFLIKVAMTAWLLCAMISLQLSIHQERSSATPLLNVKLDYLVLCVGLPLAVGILCSVIFITVVCTSGTMEFLYLV